MVMMMKHVHVICVDDGTCNSDDTILFMRADDRFDSTGYGSATS